MDLSCLSAGGSYTLSVSDAYTLSDGTAAAAAKASCTCTKYSYSPGGTPLATPSHVPKPGGAIEDVDPVVDVGEESEGSGPEPNTDLFGIQLEVRSLIELFNP